MFFFFKQKTAYEMRISDWSSDVCSSDLHWAARRRGLMMPKQDIDAIALKSCLPNVWLHRYQPESDDFVCLLAGEQVNAAWGGSIANRPLSQIIRSEQYALTRHRYRQKIGRAHI